MKLRTSNNHEIDVDFAYAPTFDDHMVVKMADSGEKIKDICAKIEGVQRFEAQTSENKIDVYIGYTELKRVSRENGAITMVLMKPKP